MAKRDVLVNRCKVTGVRHKRKQFDDDPEVLQKHDSSRISNY